MFAHDHHLDRPSSCSSDFVCATLRQVRMLLPAHDVPGMASDTGPFARLGPIGMLGSFTTQSRSLVMAFLVRLRIFPDQPARGPLACCGRSADAFG